MRLLAVWFVSIGNMSVIVRHQRCLYESLSLTAAIQDIRGVKSDRYCNEEARVLSRKSFELRVLLQLMVWKLRRSRRRRRRRR